MSPPLDWINKSIHLNSGDYDVTATRYISRTCLSLLSRYRTVTNKPNDRVTRKGRKRHEKVGPLRLGLPVEVAAGPAAFFLGSLGEPTLPPTVLTRCHWPESVSRYTRIRRSGRKRRRVEGEKEGGTRGEGGGGGGTRFHRRSHRLSSPTANRRRRLADYTIATTMTTTTTKAAVPILEMERNAIALHRYTMQRYSAGPPVVGPSVQLGSARPRRSRSRERRPWAASRDPEGA